MNNQTPAVAEPAAQNGIKKFEEKTVDSILARINDYLETGDIVLPPNYIPENAVRSAWLLLQDVTDKDGRPAIEVCTRQSIANAFLEMVIKGLSVVKKQAYFVVYGNELSLDESYLGTIAIAKRDADVKEPIANIIYKGDIFEYEIDVNTGRKRVIKHEQKLENINMDNIVGAYSVVNFNDGSTDTEIMTIAQIRQSWAMGGSKGNSPAHKNFPDQMAAKTVISRSLKIRSGSSDDAALARENDVVATAVKQEIKEKANKKELTFDDAEVVDEPKQLRSNTVVSEPVAVGENVKQNTGPGF